MKSHAPKLGEILVREGKVSQQQLERALQTHQLGGGRLGTNLIELGLIREETLLETLGRQRSSSTVAAHELQDLKPAIVRALPTKLALRYNLVPYQVRGKTLFIAAMDPGDLLREDEISFLTSFMVRTSLALELRVKVALQKYYGANTERRFLVLAQRIAEGRMPAPPPSGSRPGSTSGSFAIPTVPPPAPARESSAIFAAPPRENSGVFAPLRPAPSTPLRPAAPAPPMGEPDAFAINLDWDLPPDLPSLPPERPASFLPTLPRAEAPPVAPPSPRPSPGPPAPARPAKEPPSREVRYIELDDEDVALLGQSGEAVDPALDPTRDLSALLGPGLNPPPAAVAESRADAVAPVEASALPTQPVPDQAAPADEELLTAVEEDLESRLARAAREFQDAEIRDEIGDVLLQFSGDYFERRALLIARKEKIVGWRGEGQGIDSDRLRALEIESHSPSVFLGLREAGQFWLGPLPPLPANRALVEACGGEMPKDCLVLPVALRGKIVCYLYLDNRAGGVSGVPLGAFRRLVGKAGLAFEVYLLKNKIRIS